MGNTLYLVGEVDYTYNDEVYYRSGESSNCVKPIKLFRSEENAMEELLDKTKKVMQNFNDYYNLTSFGYSMNDIVRDPKQFMQILKKYDKDIPDYDQIDDTYEFGLSLTDTINKMTSEDLEKFIKTLHVKFFEIIEVELELLDTETRRLLGDKPELKID